MVSNSNAPNREGTSPDGPKRHRIALTFTLKDDYDAESVLAAIAAIKIASSEMSASDLTQLIVVHQLQALDKEEQGA